MRKDISDKGSLVFAELKKDSVYFVEYVALPANFKSGVWENIIKEMEVPARKVHGELLKVFFMQNGGVIYVDDFEVDIEERK